MRDCRQKDSWKHYFTIPKNLSTPKAGGFGDQSVSSLQICTIAEIYIELKSEALRHCIALRTSRCRFGDMRRINHVDTDQPYPSEQRCDISASLQRSLWKTTVKTSATDYNRPPLPSKDCIVIPNVDNFLVCTICVGLSSPGNFSLKIPDEAQLIEKAYHPP